jgi:hypothetical protein
MGAVMADAFDQVAQEQKSAQPQGAPGAQVTLPAQSPQPQGNGGQAQSPPSQGQSQGQPQGDAFDQIAAEQNAQKNALVDIPGGATAEEQAFLKSNPDHAWVPADPKFPNRPAGIYPTGKGNEWRKDPSYSQAPIDLHFAKHTLEGAATGAAAAAPAVGLAALPEVIPSVLPHTIEGVKAIGTWATKNPVQAYILYNVIKDLIPGTKRAIGLVKGVPEP